MIAGPFRLEPDRIIVSADGVPIALFEAGLPADVADQPTLVLVHGTTADHTTFRAFAPVIGRRRHLVAIDRRGRGASGDGRGGYSIELEYDDLAAVARTLATVEGRPIDVFGHSYGGRVALGAAARSGDIRRLVVYEGAPPAPDEPYQSAALAREVRAALDRQDGATALEVFLRAVVGMDDAAIASYRANPVWQLRVAAAHTILRELDAEASAAASLEALGSIGNAVLLVLGTASRGPFRAATEALRARLPHAAVVEIAGAAHAAHHTHVPELAIAVERFLDDP